MSEERVGASALRSMLLERSLERIATLEQAMRAIIEDTSNVGDCRQIALDALYPGASKQ